MGLIKEGRRVSGRSGQKVEARKGGARERERVKHAPIVDAHLRDVLSSPYCSPPDTPSRRPSSSSSTIMNAEQPSSSCWRSKPFLALDPTTTHHRGSSRITRCEESSSSSSRRCLGRYTREGEARVDCRGLAGS